MQLLGFCASPLAPQGVVSLPNSAASWLRAFRVLLSALSEPSNAPRASRGFLPSAALFGGTGHTRSLWDPTADVQVAGKLYRASSPRLLQFRAMARGSPASKLAHRDPRKRGSRSVSASPRKGSRSGAQRSRPLHLACVSIPFHRHKRRERCTQTCRLQSAVPRPIVNHAGCGFVFPASYYRRGDARPFL